ncbi:MAG: tetratricopeptide repeat protein, partial [Bacteroidota bacterium]|nr:tetratricopeptide repeat protein [Bacteroidota bacterium]
MKQVLLLLAFAFLLINSSFSQAEKKIDSLQKALQSAKFDTLKVKILNQIGIEYSGQSDFEKGLDYSKQALHIAQASKDTLGLGESYHCIGNLYLRLGKYDRSLENLLFAIKNFELIQFKKGLANCKVSVGVIYYYQKDYDKAIAYYSQAIILFKSIDFKKGMAGCLNNVGEIYRLQKKYAMALQCFKESLETFEVIKNKKGIATSFGNLGNVYYDLKNFNKALEFYLKSIEIKKEIGNKQGLALTLNNVGSIFIIKKNFQKAEEYSSRSLELAMSINSNEDIKQAYKNLAEIHFKQENYKKAYEFGEMYNNMKDSLFLAQSNEEIHEMQAQYESETKELEIAVLEKEKVLTGSLLKQEKMTKYFLAGFTLLILVFGLFLWRDYRTKKKVNVLLGTQNQEIELQKSLLEEKNKDITDSIRYAKRIQEATLPPDELVNALLPDSFILYKPKDIVSGDFYWIEQWGKQTLVAAVDCTGHGVPGAFMSMLASNLLNEAVIEHGLTQPAAILNSVRKGLAKTLRKKLEDSLLRDGMDAALISINFSENTLEFSGAYNPFWMIREGVFTEIKGDKTPIGMGLSDTEKPFINHQVQLQKGDLIYLLTDGYADQFGGSKGKKFKYSSLKETLLQNHHLPLHVQKELLDSTIEKWKGSLDQV